MVAWFPTILLMRDLGLLNTRLALLLPGASSEESVASGEPVKLTVWTHQSAEQNGNPNNAFTLFVEEKFNVDLEFQFYQDDDKNTQLNLMFESGKSKGWNAGCLAASQDTKALR